MRTGDKHRYGGRRAFASRPGAGGSLGGASAPSSMSVRRAAGNCGTSRKAELAPKRSRSHAAGGSGRTARSAAARSGHPCRGLPLLSAAGAAEEAVEAARGRRQVVAAARPAGVAAARPPRAAGAGAAEVAAAERVAAEAAAAGRRPTPGPVRQPRPPTSPPGAATAGATTRFRSLPLRISEAGQREAAAMKPPVALLPLPREPRSCGLSRMDRLRTPKPSESSGIRSVGSEAC